MFIFFLPTVWYSFTMTDSFAGATNGLLYLTVKSTFKMETLEIFWIIVQFHGHLGWLSNLLLQLPPLPLSFLLLPSEYHLFQFSDEHEHHNLFTSFHLSIKMIYLWVQAILNVGWLILILSSTALLYSQVITIFVLTFCFGYKCTLFHTLSHTHLLPYVKIQTEPIIMK